MSSEELIDQYIQSKLEEKSEFIKNIEEFCNSMQNNRVTALNTELNRTNDNNTEMYDMRDFNSEDLYHNFYSDDNNSDEDTNEESD